MVYNLSSGICIRSKFILLSTVISGPNSLGRNIDIYLSLLIDEFNQLWSSETLMYDVLKKKNLDESSFDVDY